MEVSSRSVHDESALFDEDDNDDEIVLGRSQDDEKPETSKQRLLSQAKLKPEFEGLRTTPAGHKIQDIRELMTVPVRFSSQRHLWSHSNHICQVIVTADLTKSPPVIKVYSVNPFAEKK
jgi:protein SSD1